MAREDRAYTAVQEWRPGDGSPLPEINTTNLASRWTRFCWWLSRRLGGRSIFGKADFT